LMKTQTDKKIADEMQRTYDAQREAQMRRQMLERETAAANMQSEVVRSEQQVRIHETAAQAVIAAAKGQAEAARVRASAEADATRLAAEAEAMAITARGEAAANAERARGAAVAASYQAGVKSLGDNGYTSLQMAQTLAVSGLKLVPDVVLGEGRANLGDVLLARMAAGYSV